METREIQLTQGQVAIVDADDYEELSRYKWYAAKTTYGGYKAVRQETVSYVPRKQRTIYMHRQVMKCGFGRHPVVDHVNHDTLDNRKSNLRVCSNRENMMNQVQNGGSSKYKGVSFSKKQRKYAAYISIDRRRRHLGTFETEEEAAIAYNTAAIEHYGEFAYLNQTESRKDNENVRTKVI